jgi:rubrerythrin
MLTAFAPNGIKTREPCPQCHTPDVEVEHGLAYEKNETKLVEPQHYWHCPECGDSMRIVLYDCPICLGGEQNER